MSFIDDLKGLINDILQNVSLLKVKTVRSIGRKPMRFEHDSGGSITFNADGTIDIIGYDAGILTDHALLNNLTWSTAGHTIDTDVDMVQYAIDNCRKVDFDTIGASNLAYISFQQSGETGETLTYRAENGHVVMTGVTEVFKFLGSSVSSLVPLSMNSNKITGLADPTNAQDAATRAYVLANVVTDHGLLEASSLLDDDHTQYLLTNGTRSMTGHLNMGTSYGIINLATPTLDYDASTKKYVDDNLFSGVHSDLSSLTWSASGHTINATLEMNSNDITEVDQLSFISGSEITEPDAYTLQYDAETYHTFRVGSVLGNIMKLYSETIELFGAIYTDGILTLKSSSTNDIKLDAGGNIDAASNIIENVATPTLTHHATTKAYVDGITGTTNDTFTINNDASVGANAYYKVERGSSGGDARITWNESDDEWEFDDSSVFVPIQCSLIKTSDGIHFDGDVGSYKMAENDTSGDLEITVPTGKSIVFKVV